MYFPFVVLHTMRSARGGSPDDRFAALVDAADYARALRAFALALALAFGVLAAFVPAALVPSLLALALVVAAARRVRRLRRLMAATLEFPDDERSS